MNRCFPSTTPAQELASVLAEVARLAAAERVARDEVLAMYAARARAQRGEAAMIDRYADETGDRGLVAAARALARSRRAGAARAERVIGRCGCQDGLGDAPPTRIEEVRRVRDVLDKRCRRWLEVSRNVVCPESAPSWSTCRVKVRVRVPCSAPELDLLRGVAATTGLEDLRTGHGFVDASLPLSDAHVGSDGRLYGYAKDGCLYVLDDAGRLSKVAEVVFAQDADDGVEAPRNAGRDDDRLGLQGEDSMSAVPEYIQSSSNTYEEVAFDEKPVFEAMGDVSDVDADVVPGGGDDQHIAGGLTADNLATGPDGLEFEEEPAPGPDQSGAYDDRGSAGFEDLTAGDSGDEGYDRSVRATTDPWEGAVSEADSDPVEQPAPPPPQPSLQGNAAKLRQALSRSPSVESILGQRKSGHHHKKNGKKDVGEPNGAAKVSVSPSPTTQSPQAPATTPPSAPVSQSAGPGSNGTAKTAASGMGQYRRPRPTGMGQAPATALTPDQQAFANLFGGVANVASAVVPAALGVPTQPLPGQPGYVPQPGQPGYVAPQSSNVVPWLVGGVAIAGVLGLAWYALRAPSSPAKKESAK